VIGAVLLLLLLVPLLLPPLVVVVVLLLLRRSDASAAAYCWLLLSPGSLSFAAPLRSTRARGNPLALGWSPDRIRAVSPVV